MNFGRRSIALAVQLMLAVAAAQNAEAGEVNDRDELTRRIQSDLENRFDISGIRMSPFALTQHCINRFIFTHARDREQQQALLTGRSTMISDVDERHILRCLAENGVTGRR